MNLSSMVLIANKKPDLHPVSSAIYFKPNVEIVSSLKSEISITSFSYN
jgi:hypothetical protein